MKKILEKDLNGGNGIFINHHAKESLCERLFNFLKRICNKLSHKAPA